jgi:hypothetical protein
MNAETGLVGASGEHYVAGYLSGFHLVVAMPRGGTPGSDLFVSKEAGGRMIRIQVKTGTRATRRFRDVGDAFVWKASYSAIGRNDPNLWYAFVWLKGWPEKESLPEVFFVPSAVVVNCLEDQKAQNDKYPTFWVCVADAERFRGPPGLQAMQAAMDF